MKKFWKDYQVLCEQTGEFYMKHRKGVIVLYAALFGVGMAAGYILERKQQKEHEEFNAKYRNYGYEE